VKQRASGGLLPRRRASKKLEKGYGLRVLDRAVFLAADFLAAGRFALAVLAEPLREAADFDTVAFFADLSAPVFFFAVLDLADALDFDVAILPSSVEHYR
jgi:hypothetical protein